MNDTDKKITTGKQSLPILVKILAGFAILALLTFAGVIAGQIFNKISIQSESSKDASRQNNENLANEPISILPETPDGITILQKQPELAETAPQIALAPIAQGSEIASGFAMDLGPSDSFLDLTRRFVEITASNGIENFQRLEPRAVLRETVTGLEARLLVGPFDTEQQAKEACSILILPDEGSCNAVLFQGDLIDRE
jgi:hypothetical protein